MAQITVTLPDDVLEKIDKKVDQSVYFDSRSQALRISAIEHLGIEDLEGGDE
jgi:Arc/MetJ-type ribon-helix-helix transcriptional regulator